MFRRNTIPMLTALLLHRRQGLRELLIDILLAGGHLAGQADGVRWGRLLGESGIFLLLRFSLRELFFAELLDDGGSAKGGGVEVGDVLRATTAVTMGMSYPAWQLMLGGCAQPRVSVVGRPTLPQSV